MASPKHLWSGDWQEESGGAARRGEPTPEAAPDRPAPAPEPPRLPRRARRPRVSTQMRRWALAATVALVAALASAALVTVIAQGTSHHAGGPGIAWMGAELRTWPAGGVLIEDEVAGGPAQVAGLLPGDLIIGIDTSSITSASDVTGALARHSPGDVVGVHAQRGVSDFTARVTLASRPSGMAVP